MFWKIRLLIQMSDLDAGGRKLFSFNGLHLHLTWNTSWIASFWCWRCFECLSAIYHQLSLHFKKRTRDNNICRWSFT
jgi:hypothetical protein